MKKIIRNIIAAASFLTTFAVSSCIEEQAITPQPAENEPVILRFTATLADQQPATRLDYTESGKALKAVWNSEDQFVANAQPTTLSYVYTFDLVEGAGTATGVFECGSRTSIYLPENLSSNAWTLYFPGSKIRCEKEYLDFSYTNQVQKGNGSLKHLDEYHTIRHKCTDGSNESSTGFIDEFIDFSDETSEESACMRISLANLPSVTPTEVSLKYSAPSGQSSYCFYTYNVLRNWWSDGSFQPNTSATDKISIRLEEFEPCTEAKVYIMMSNNPVELKAGGSLDIAVKCKEGKIYTCRKTLKSDATLEGGKMHSISGSTWTESVSENIDGFDDPEGGIIVLQEASKGNGTDIVIMGDGFSKPHFGNGGNYDKVMRQAYDDFFSIEPFASLKDYFNVYYINAVSEDDHDAQPLMNGAIQGTANTVFGTQFTENSTSIKGDNNAARSYAAQAIRHKGGKGGKPVDEEEATSRANSSLMIVMVNVACHAGTCTISYSTSNDYCKESSVAYSALSTDAESRRLTLIHEAGGHGFGKLADEYSGQSITQFSTSSWNNLIQLHNSGLYRNINEHWNEVEKADGWQKDLRDTYTDESNVYWSDLLVNDPYGYKTSEGLGIYRGAYTYDNLYCRPTINSAMRDQFADNGKFFNAISRWAIWYRLMRLTGSTSATDFKSSLSDFIKFDETINIRMAVSAQGRGFETKSLLPLAPPVLEEVE